MQRSTRRFTTPPPQAPNVVGFVDMIGCAPEGIIPATQVNGQSYTVGSKFSFQGAIYQGEGSGVHGWCKYAFDAVCGLPAVADRNKSRWITQRHRYSRPGAVQ